MTLKIIYSIIENTIEATDSFGTKVIITYNPNETMRQIYDLIRQEFIKAYTNMKIDFICTTLGDQITYQCTDHKTPPNTLTVTYDATSSSKTNRQYIIGQFVDLYGLPDSKTQLYQLLTKYG